MGIIHQGARVAGRSIAWSGRVLIWLVVLPLIAAAFPSIALPDLSIISTDDSGGLSVPPGGTIRYTIEITNTGDTDATNTVLTDTIDVNTTFSSGPDINYTPVIVSDGGGASSSVNADENQTLVTDVNSTDPDGNVEGAGLTYTITGGADSALLAITSSTGVLTFNSAPDFEIPTDSGTDGTYEVQVTVTDSTGLTDSQDVAVTVVDTNDEPVITSDGGGATATANAAENQTAVTTVTATDEDLPAQTLTFSISGGTDQALFSIGAASGVLTFASAPDFENPLDAGSDNVYDVQVTVTDNGVPNLADVQDIAVTVTNESEGAGS